MFDDGYALGDVDHFGGRVEDDDDGEGLLELIRDAENAEPAVLHSLTDLSLYSA